MVFKAFFIRDDHWENTAEDNINDKGLGFMHWDVRSTKKGKGSVDKEMVFGGSSKSKNK